MKRDDLLKDLANLTGVSAYVLHNIAEVAILAISHAVAEDIVNNDSDTTEIDMGIGILTIHHTDSEVKYRFSPNRKLNDHVTTAITSKETPIIKIADESIRNRLMHAYKELF